MSEAENYEYNDYDSMLEGLDSDGGEESSINASEQSEGNSEESSEELSTADQFEKFVVEDEKESEGDTEAQKVEGESEQAPDLLKLLNDEAISRNGEPVKFESVEQIKELLSKGNDYTQKTQELASQREEYEADIKQQYETLETERAELAQAREDQGEVAIHNEVFGEVLENLKESDPDLFEDIQRAFQKGMANHNRSVNNPAVTAMQKRLDEMQGKMDKGAEDKRAEELKGIETEWNEGWTSLESSILPKFKKMGVNVDEKIVADAWGKDPDGKMTPEEAVWQVYGKQIQKVMDAKLKHQKTKSDSQRKRGPESLGEQEAPKPKENESYADYILNGIT
jgi:hypothetical protein